MWKTNPKGFGGNDFVPKRIIVVQMKPVDFE